VVFEHPTNREILGEVGNYAQLGDANSLADTTMELLLDESLRRKRGSKGRIVAEEHSWEKIGEKILDVYNSVME
jgi:glycosyltransferase involved in cell wall biosynthesis